MTRSEQINELAVALTKAQRTMKGAAKDSENPHFRSKYADLASVWDACREPLTANGLSVVQSPRLISAGDGQWLVEVETTLLHTSGQFMADALAVPVTKADAQGAGSAITYARRYALAAFVGVAPEDDDGNAASATNGHSKAAAPAPKPATKPAGFDNWLDDLRGVADDGTKRLSEAWGQSNADYRRYLLDTNKREWDRLKAVAAKAAEREAVAQ